MPCAVILDCGITEAERKQTFHGEQFCFPGRAVRCHFATYFKMLLPKAVCRGYSGLRHNGSGTEANLSRRAMLLPSEGHSPPFCKLFDDVASEGRLPCAVILDCGITEAERKQIFHGELFCFPGPFAVIHGEPQSPGGPCPGPGTTTEPRGCDRDPDPDRPPSQELHPVCP